jgi:hypothetical protein
MFYILAALSAAIQIAIVFVIIRKFIRTRDVGFVWLGLAVVVWPLLERMMDQGTRILVDGLVRRYGDVRAGDLVAASSMGKQLIRGILLLVAVFFLRSDARPAVSD